MKVPFADLVLSLQTGKRPKGGVGTVESGILSLGGEHISANGTVNLSKPRFVPLEFYESLKKGRILPNDILIVKDGATTGRVALVPGLFSSEAAANEHIFVLRTDERKILQQFAFHFLRSATGQAAIMSDFRGAAQGGIGRTFVDKISVPLLSLDEQRRIVGILNRSAKIERLRAQAADCLREFIPALFVRMFGDPVENPMGWEVRSLGELCVSVQYGISRKAIEQPVGTPILRMGNVTYEGLLDCTENNLKYVALNEQEREKHVLASGDILFNRTNSKDLVGKTGVWDGRFEAVPASYFIRVRVNRTALNPTYLWAFMNSSAMKRRLFQLARGAIGQANINAKELKAVRVPVPPIGMQGKYAHIVEGVQSGEALGYTGRETAKSLSASLMNRLLDSAA